jgi:integral membrane protein (TIGR01906 family)
MSQPERGGDVRRLEDCVRFVRQVAALLFIIALPVALVTSNVRLVANTPRTYEYATDHYDTAATTGISRPELLRASGELRDYFNSDDDTVFIRVERDGEPISLFNDRETAHLRDVKDLFQMSFRVEEAAIVFILAYVVMVFIWAREGSMRTLAREVLASGVLSLVVLAALGGSALTDFDAVWTKFHVVGFTNGNWEFDPSRDRLIQMIPEDFWRDVTLWVGGATLAELALLAAAAAVYLGVTRERSVSYTVADGAQP